MILDTFLLEKLEYTKKEEEIIVKNIKISRNGDNIDIPSIT